MQMLARIPDCLGRRYHCDREVKRCGSCSLRRRGAWLRPIAAFSSAGCERMIINERLHFGFFFLSSRLLG